jgi:hypothetical protein
MIHLITYGDGLYDETKKRLHNQANNLGWFDTITSYGPDDLEQDFKEQFKDILELSRGGGYWIWKPYIIKKHLDKLQDNDILIYLDAGCSINKNGTQRFNEYVNMVNNNDAGIISFQMDHIEKKWTTSEIFKYFNIGEDSEVKNSGQVMATVQIIKKNPNSIKLINVWNEVLYTNPLLFTDYYNNNQQSYFKDNRHDQSVFSIIRKLHNSIILNDETYFEPFGNEESLKYPFWVTRLK